MENNLKNVTNNLSSLWIRQIRRTWLPRFSGSRVPFSVCVFS